MNFLEACRAMQQGKKVQLSDWGDLALFRDSDGQFLKMKDLKGGNVPLIIQPTEILRDDWRIIPEMMTFIQAVKAMKEGKNVTRPTFKCAINVNKKTGRLESVSDSFLVVLLMEDIDADDWEVVD